MKYIDFFPNHSNFTVQQSRNFQTTFGGILTFFSIFLCLIMSYDVGFDLIYKKNPKIFSKNLIENHKAFKLNNKNLTLAFRIEDVIGNKLDFDDLFYAKFRYLFYEMNSTSSSFEEKKVERINYKKCSENSMDNKKLQESIKMDDWFCLDLDLTEIKWGGFWNTDFLHYLDLRLDTCNGKEEGNGKKCAKTKELIKFLDEEVYVSFMFPKIMKNFHDLNNPLEIKYDNYYRNIDMKLKSYEVCRFNKVYLKDDQGWITSTITENDKLNFENCSPQYFFIDLAEYEDNKNTEFFLAEFYFLNWE